MTINVVVKKQGNEHNLQVIKRFSNKIRALGLIQHLKNNQYRLRPLSKNMKRRQALIRLKKREIIQKMIKEGKISPTQKVKVQVKIKK